jgi:hypothetical protein
MNRILALVSATAIAAAAHAAPLPLPPRDVNPELPEEDVGEVESFGHSVIYLGLAATASVHLVPDCTQFDPPITLPSRCFNIPASSNIGFSAPDLRTIRLPAGASQSLLCYSIDPLVDISFDNRTPVARDQQLSLNIKMIVQNEILNDPELIDPRTGLPYAGRLTRGIPLALELSQQSPSTRDDFKALTGMPGCGMGLISKRMLRTLYGLSETQANEFFTKPITLTFGLSGNVKSAASGAFSYQMRLYGDKAI